MACGFCHVGPHPLHPPADPEHPEWENLSSKIGAQYLRPARIFVLPHHESNFLFQVVNSMPPGTIDTSALATDNINNPRAMNALYNVGTRLKIAAEESLAGGNLELPGTQKLASNALRGHIWDNFSSETYKNLPSVGKIEVNDPISGDRTSDLMPRVSRRASSRARNGAHCIADPPHPAVRSTSPPRYREPRGRGGS